MQYAPCVSQRWSLQLSQMTGGVVVGDAMVIDEGCQLSRTGIPRTITQIGD